jgi:membrane protein DedA with SNARE-associated domain
MKKENLQKIIQTIFTAINFLLVILIIALWLISIFNKELILKIIEWIGIVIQWLWNWNYLILFSSSLIEAFPVIWVVIPWQNIMLLTSMFFAEKSIENLVFVYIVASIWAIIWNYIWYLLGKKYWDTFFEKYWLRFWIWLTEVKYLKKWINKWWPIWVTFWKFHNLTRAFLPFIAWSMGMKKPAFMFYNIIGSIIRAISIITLWTLFWKYYEMIINHIWKILLVIIILVWIYTYLFKKEEFKKYWKEKNEELDKFVKK